MSKITIRFLEDTDLVAVSAIHIKAFSGRALTQLGMETVRRYYDWQLRGPHEAVCLGIFREECLVGFCFGGTFHGTLSGFLLKNKLFLFLRVLTHPWLIYSPFFRERITLAINTLLRIKSKAPHQSISKTKSFGILAIAIDPQYQGIGLGKELITETEKLALERGFDHMHLTVSKDNNISIAFYEKMGWKKAVTIDKVWRGKMVKEI